MREKYETLKLNDLRDIAKKRGIKGASSMKKSEIIDLMCELDEKEAAKAEAAKAPAKPAKDSSSEDKPAKPAGKKKKIVVTTGNAAPSPAPAAEEKAAPVEDKKTAPVAKEDAEEEEFDGDIAAGIFCAEATMWSLSA